MSLKSLVDLCKSLVFQKKVDETFERTARRDLMKLGTSLTAASMFLAASKNSEVLATKTKIQTFTVDLVGDGNSFASEFVDTVFEVENGKRGQSFIVNSDLHPGNTINPSTLPNAPGIIGKWFCWGVYNVDKANSLKPSPLAPFLSTELFLLNNGDQLVTFGGEFFIPTFTRVVSGGTGKFLGATGNMEFQNIGVNGTLGNNGRYIVRLVLPASIK